MSFEAYSVAIRLRLLDSVSSGLVGMAAQFAAFNRHVNTSQAQLSGLENQLRRLKMMGFLGGAMLGVGSAGLYALRGPLDEAKKWQQEAARFASLGFGNKVNQDAQQFAAGMKTYGTSARENLALVSDAMAVFKDMNAAKMAAPILAKMKFGNEAVFGEGGGANERKFMDMLKVIEMRRGLSSPAEFSTQANFVQKVIAGSRGRVDASQMLQALKTGGVALSNMRNDEFYLGSEGLIQEFGGSRYGTAMMSIYQNLVQGRTTSAAAAELVRLGLIDKSGVVFNSLGGVKKFQPGAFKGTGLFNDGRQNPVTLLNEVLLPAFAAKGITSESDILLELGRILTNRTGSGLLARTYQQRSTLLNQWGANRGAMDVNQLAEEGRKTPAGKMIELTAKWHDVLRELGLTILPIAIKGISGLTTVLKGVLSFAREFPTLTKGLVIAFASLSALMVAGGAFTLIKAGVEGLKVAFMLSKGGTVGSMLGDLALGVGSLARVLGTAGLLAGVGTAAYAGTRWIADHVTPKDWTFGGWLYDKVHGSYDPNAPSTIRGASRSGTIVRTQVNLDGKKIAEVVSKHQGNSAGAPQTGTSLFDGRMALTPAGAAR